MTTINVNFNYINAHRNVTKTENATKIGDKFNLEITKASIGSNTSIDITQFFEGVVLETTLSCEVESDCAQDKIYYQKRIVSRANHTAGDRTSYTNVVTDITSNDDVYIVQSGNHIDYYDANTDLLIKTLNLTTNHAVCELVELD